MRKLSFILILVIIAQSVIGQTVTNVSQLKSLSQKYYSKSDRNKIAVEEYARKNNIPLRIETDSTLAELIYIDDRGNPQYYTIHNENSAKTMSTNEVYSGGGAGLSLDGSGVTVGEWDGGSVRTTHQELVSRVTVMDGGSMNWHSTHVAGTIMASGVQSAAKGMAYSANLKSYQWTSDVAEMASEASDGLLVSNHSYGYLRGWSGSTWYGDPAISTIEDYKFGFYDVNTKNWDEVAYNAPYYLIVKSSGNDRNEGPVGGTYPKDGPYDCISQQAVAKNILTVGSVNDITSGYTQPIDVVLASSSSCGPTDDGRIKPDIVANGIGLYSSNSGNDTDYTSASGTSMATPSVAGSVALLIQHWENINGIGSKMRSATAKAIIIHTADESGTTEGPDYQFGWGLMNTENAALKISEDITTDVIHEGYLEDGETYTRNITTTGTSPIKATLVWTDAPGTPPAATLDPTDTMLVADLDIKITQLSNTYYPWKLDRDNPGGAATHVGENDVDNVEVIDINTPIVSTTYTITIDHDGTLSGGGQAFSLVLSGDIDNSEVPEAEFYADNTEPTTDQTVNLFDASVNIPSSWLWTFTPSSIEFLDGTSATSQHPIVRFDATGTFEISLTATNSSGSDTETKASYITVGLSPQNYCDAYSINQFGYIKRVQLRTINNSSTFTNVGGLDPDDLYYEDFTSVSTDLVASGSYNIIVSNVNDYSNLDLAIWIDWNRDGDFEDINEEVLCEVNNGGKGTYTIVVPVDADLGSTRMRLRTKWTDGYGCLPCGTTYEGEVEDYTISVVPLMSTTWIGNSTSWSDPTNWTGGIVPDHSFQITIPEVPTGNPDNFPIVQTETTAKCFSLALESNATITINGNLEIEN